VDEVEEKQMDEIDAMNMEEEMNIGRSILSDIADCMLVSLEDYPTIEDLSLRLYRLTDIGGYCLY
jgi:hypothetical protein